MKAGVDGWGQASMVLRQDRCKHPELIVATSVEQLRLIRDASNEKAIEGPLLDAAFVADLPSWPEMSADQKKAFCDAAKSLVDGGKTDDAKTFGKKAMALCR